MIAGTAKFPGIQSKKFYQDCRDLRAVPCFVPMAEALLSTSSTLVFCVEAWIVAVMDLLSDQAGLNHISSASRSSCVTWKSIMRRETMAMPLLGALVTTNNRAAWECRHGCTSLFSSKDYLSHLANAHDDHVGLFACPHCGWV
jgi:hypothetical protein